MSALILKEYLDYNESKLIVEHGDSGKKGIFLYGTCMQANIKNRNGRIYPLSELSREVDSDIARINAHNGIMGELDHPNNLQINLNNVSHKITNLKIVNENIIGKLKIIEDLPMGKIVKTLIDEGVKLGLSSRGAGDVASDGTVSNFMLVTLDIVANPSAPGAVPDVIYESLMNSKSGYKTLTLAEQLIEDKNAQKYFEREILKFIHTDLLRK
jgi:hypothetical protein